MMGRGGPWSLLMILLLVLGGLPVDRVGAQTPPRATLDPARGPIGTRVTIAGSGWPSGRQVTITLGKPDQPIDAWYEWAKATPSFDGSFQAVVTVPRQYVAINRQEIRVAPGDYSVLISTTSGPDGVSVSVGATFTVTDMPVRPPTINWRFADYYYSHDGGRVLGNPISEVRFEGAWRAQYFEKGRIEDHEGEEGAVGAWRFMFGRLGADLAAGGNALPVGGDTSTVTYASLQQLATAERRLPPPPGWSGVLTPGPDESVFIPYDSYLRPAPGHYVPGRFWAYINQPALFPAGWLHDIGLPLTPAVPATVTKVVNGASVERPIRLQLFERTVLTDDPANPAGFQIERANIGADALRLLTGPVIPGDVVLPAAFSWIGPTSTDQDLPAGMAPPAWRWESHHNRAAQMDAIIQAMLADLAREGWMVTAQEGGAAAGTIEAMKGQRMQVIAWWLGTRPVTPPDQPELGTRARVTVGVRG
jgi:hypothetical protein